jgi:hypothetical protein
LQNEHGVTIEWRKLFSSGNVTKETIDAARKLIDDLSAESPLRVRFGNELDELQRIAKTRTTKHN